MNDDSAVFRRHSVRTFTSRPLPPEVVESIKAEITQINTVEAGMHFTLRTDSPGPFQSFRRSYGAFHNASDYVAVIADTSYPYARERAGFHAERLALYCVSLGLGTCFVSGTYDHRAVDARIRVGETLLFLLAIGYEDTSRRPSLTARITTALTHRRTMEPEDFIIGAPEDCRRALASPQFRKALKAVATAPSALNRRPARIAVGSDMSVRALAKGDSEADMIDLGIAMANFSAIIPGEWEWGNPALFLPL